MAPALEEMIEEYLVFLEVEGKRPSTIKMKRSLLTIFQRWMAKNYPDLPVKQIRAKHLAEYLLYRRENGLSKGSEHQNYVNLGAFFKWAMKMYPKHVKKNPTTKIARPKYTPPIKEFPDIDIIEKMIAACDTTSFKGARDKLLFTLIKETGGRAIEILSLRVDDFNEAYQYIHIREGKGGKPREVPYGDATTLALIAYKEHRAQHRYAHLPEMFLGQRGPFKYEGLRLIFKEYSLMVGTKVLTPHSFRHAFVDLCKRRGVTEDAMMELLGWSTRAMLDHYAKAGRAQRAIMEYREKL